MKKKALLLLMALSMAFSLAACGKKETPEAPEAGPETNTETEAGEENEPAEEAGEKVEIGKIVTVLPNVRGDGGTHDLACRASESIAESIGAELDIVEL